jgi:bifunctional non-homologous end joining protein LigD
VTIDEYRRKRTPAATPEPFGGSPSLGPLRFVVQRHQARTLHYDLRLERDGVLLSWAVPKGIPLTPGSRHLAVHVEDHPLDYAGFEGEIPAGQYGAGTVAIWDSGTYELIEVKPDGGMTVRLHGSRAKGVWALVPANLDGKTKNWLLLCKAEVARARGYTPMLATSSSALPQGSGWVYEPKWDGYRVLATLAGGEVTLTSRNGNDLTERFASVAKALPEAIRSQDAVLDGEVCALDSDGTSRFGLLQSGAGRLVYVVFDLLETDGEPRIDLPLEERRAQLDQLVAPHANVLVSPWFSDGAALLSVAKAQRLEGVVAKRRNARYRPGLRSPDWQKVKLRQRQEFVVAGWTTGAGRRSDAFGALVLAVNDGGLLRYVGNVGSGFTDTDLDRLRQLLVPLGRAATSLDEAPRLPRVSERNLHWVEPSLVVEVEFAEWTTEGRLRAPVYLGLRDDRGPESVVREAQVMPDELRRGRRVLRFSNLDKPFWPEEGITKGDLLTYYRAVAPSVVPHLRGRPFTMKRYPDGWQGKSFFQKNTPKHAPDWLRTVPFPATSRDGETRMIDYAVVDDDLALLWVVSMGCIDLHTWTSRADKPERPDWVIFDLDPSEGCGFPEVVETALLLHELLDLIGLRSYPKTSGSRGLHVLIPISRRHSHAQAREFASTIGAALARAHPGLVTTQWSKAKRTGVLVDANQNGPGKTTAAVYSVRPRAGAPVSTPLRWEEVIPGLDPLSFTMPAVLDRVARHGDLFAPVLTGGQSLTAALKSVS